MIRTFIQISSLLLTLEAAFFLAKGNLGLSAEMIAELSSTKWNYNSNIVDGLARQRAETWIGVVMLLAAFTLQMWNALWPMRFVDFGVHRGAAIYAVVLCLLIGVGAEFASRELAATTAKRVEAVLEEAQSPAEPNREP